MAKYEFEPIPAGTDIQDLMTFAGKLGHSTFGLFDIRAENDRGLVLATRRYKAKGNIPMLPKGVIQWSSDQVDMILNGDSPPELDIGGIVIKNYNILSDFAYAPITEGMDPVFTVPVTATATEEGELSEDCFWMPYKALIENNREKLPSNSLYAPHLELTLSFPYPY